MHQQATWSPVLAYGLQQGSEILLKGLKIQMHLY